MNPSPSKRPPILAIWLVALLFLALSAVSVWARPSQESLRWTIPTFTPTPTPSTGSLCVLVYHDHNRDGIRQPSEELLSGAAIAVRGVESGAAMTKTTDSAWDPCCFDGLSPDLYVVLRQNPPGFTSTTEDSWGAVISANVSIQVPFGAVASEPHLVLPLVLNLFRDNR